jgi:Tol biopolymer transport system component
VLAFSSNRVNSNFFNIYQLDLNTNTVTPITSGNYEDLSPSWSPEGTKIAFTRNLANASREIFVHHVQSGQDIRLTNNTVNDTDPSWSPSGRIIFARQSEDDSRAALFEMDAVDADGDGAGDHVQPITTPNMTRSPSIPTVEKRSSSSEVRKLAGEGPVTYGNSSSRMGPLWIHS